MIKTLTVDLIAEIRNKSIGIRSAILLVKKGRFSPEQGLEFIQTIVDQLDEVLKFFEQKIEGER